MPTFAMPNALTTPTKAAAIAADVAGPASAATVASFPSMRSVSRKRTWEASSSRVNNRGAFTPTRAKDASCIITRGGNLHQTSSLPSSKPAAAVNLMKLFSPVKNRSRLDRKLDGEVGDAGATSSLDFMEEIHAAAAADDDLRLRPTSHHAIKDEDKTDTNATTASATWHIKIGTPMPNREPSLICGSDHWMCKDCSVGFPSLTSPCEKCKTMEGKEKSLQEDCTEARMLTGHNGTCVEATPTRSTDDCVPTRGLSLVTPTYELDELGLGGISFEWDQDEIDTAQRWQEEQQEEVHQKGEEEDELDGGGAHLKEDEGQPADYGVDETIGSSVEEEQHKAGVSVAKTMKEESFAWMMAEQQHQQQQQQDLPGKKRKERKKTSKKKRKREELDDSSLNKTVKERSVPLSTPSAKLEVKEKARGEKMRKKTNNAAVLNQDAKKEKDKEEEDAPTTFSLYDPKDEEHINPIHNLVRRDIWEGFVVSTATTTCTTGASSSISCNSGKNATAHVTNNRINGRLDRYAGTIGFRCRFCKHAPLSQRAEKSAVYPRCIERIYLSNIRFQRDHILQCTYIPTRIKKEYSNLKQNSNKSRGKKKYWITSAHERGLCNGEEDGIVFQSDLK